MNDDIFEAYLNCKYKGFLKLNSESGNNTKYEDFQNELREEIKNKVMLKIIHRYNQDDILHVESASTANLKIGRAVVLCASLENKKRSCHYDVLKKVEGKSKLGNFHYIPVVVSENNKLSKSIKLLVTFKSIVLGDIQGKFPELGELIYGDQLKTYKIRLITHLKETQKNIRDIEKIDKNKIEPRLMLNRNCQICEFMDSCRAKAVEKDDLSLLGGISEKEIIKRNNRGIFNVHQLSYTFRPTKRMKAEDRPHPFTHALKALAIREQQTYIQEIPQLPACETEIYLDFEGLPDKNLIYLIGMTIKEGQKETQLSLWCNSDEEEEKFFGQFFEIVLGLNNFTIYHYGNYEIQSLKKLNKKLDDRFKDEISRVIKNSVNILTIFSSSVYPPTYTNGLKDIASFLGFRWSAINASCGEESGNGLKIMD